ncbi:MAG: T9SS type A sorting domain-containing protein [Bacteroidetes bacterium]|nr:T9SS type A sorting domain-containing protein [Bacteroidota bacterium]
MKTSPLQKILLLVFVIQVKLLTQQISIYPVEQMPNFPEPYLMRDWQQVAVGYDSLVFNFEAVGEYLPLIGLNTNTDNYPGHNSFGLHTVVGTSSPTSAEAINCLPAVIGATLVGIDKTQQDGNNYVLMCEEWFNKRPEQNVYKNHPVDDTKDDWWYETMPNVFFYQLYDLYPHTGDFDYQFVSVADRWLEAVVAMNGSATPWQIPYMNYTGWDLATMTPVTSDVKEPESAGALAWILYNAYVETGDEKYKIGAEWCMEYLDGLETNPSYELQLAYGAYTAARMNAEIGTDYDVKNLLGWCFFVGPLRDWGAILGRWGNYDVSGLIGEADGNNDYAFLMNTFEQIGALVPLVRYDDRFARAIGKWVLNAANAARLFYPNYLPENYQDSEEWSYAHDPNSYIGHEAIREEMYGVSPYATGDAINGGWGETNLALYGSSHVGILGGILDTTNVSKILKLDLLKTDYFGKDAYPTYLFYNPYGSGQTVTFELDNGTHDIYDAITNSIIGTSVSGSANITIPADGVVMAVLIPSGSQINYDLQKSLVNNRVIDFNNGIDLANYPPRIKSLASANNLISVLQSANIYCTAVDNDVDDEITYLWSSTGGTLNGDGSNVTWTAPGETGNYTIECIVDDGEGQDTANVTLEVLEYLNAPPVINKLSASPRKINVNSETTVVCTAEDEDGDNLSYTFYYNGGLLSGEGNSVVWNAPANEGDYFISCSVSDGRGGVSEDSISVRVRDFSLHVPGNLVAFYPFNGNANDVSGNNLNGIVSGPDMINDRFGNSNEAYYFNGISDRITIPNDALLNFQDAISISTWIKVSEFFEREAYPLSHGSWEKRWKVSITNNRFRWTLKTSSGVKDLDSETLIEKGLLYHLVVLYSGDDYEIYLNGELDSFSNYSGAIAQTSYDFTIGQILPGNSSYNFKGELDDLRIYDYGLSYEEIQNLYDMPSSLESGKAGELPTETRLYQNYPNPFNPTTKIRYSVSPASEHVVIKVYDLLGREVTTLVNELKAQGTYIVEFNSNSINGQLTSGIYFYTLKVGKYNSTKKFVLMK